ncbi:MAG: CocE/NonD family hydrolase [Acidimicrobiales bacterium]
MTVVSRIVASLARLSPPTVSDVRVQRDLAMEMPDGAVLLADRWHAADPLPAAAPVVLMRTPYGRRQVGMIGRLFAERGYQAVIQSCRGTFGSGGEWVPFRNERADGLATLDWVSAQPWFAGEVATFGPSYLGLTQWALARDCPGFVKAMALDVTASNFREAVVYPSDCFALETALAWLYQLENQERGALRAALVLLARRRALRSAYSVLPVSEADAALVGHKVDFFRDWLLHEDAGDPWWDPVDFGRDLGRTPPSSHVAGWYDIFLPRQLDDYLALRAAGRSARLTVGPWSHVSPGGLATMLRDGIEWFDGFTGHDSTGTARTTVRVFVMGARRWVEIPEWPPPAAEEHWHLHPGARLDRSTPPDSSPDRYRFDPRDPTPANGGASLDSASTGPKNQRRREIRSDVLTYTSGPLEEDVTVIGPLSAHLHVTSTLDDADFFVRLCDVSSRGRSKNLSDGIVHLHCRKAVRAEDGSIAVRIDMWPTANTFRQGHRIRLQVSSGAHPLFARNCGTGERLMVATNLRVADNEVFHDPEHPSYLALPVVT